jgi:parallel beta-helix repeat protein
MFGGKGAAPTLIVLFLLLSLPLLEHGSIGFEGVAASNVIRVPQNYKTIKEAIDAANAGDTILVSSGTYPEWDLHINKTLSLVGENATTTIIDGDGASANILSIDADNVSLSGFTIQNCSQSGVRLQNSAGSTISGNAILHCYYGLGLSQSNYSTIIDNNVLNNSYLGIVLSSSRYNIIKDNIVAFNYMFGLAFCGTPSSSFNIVTHNTIKYTLSPFWTGAGFELDTYTRDNIVYHNNFIHNSPDNAMDDGYNVWDNGCEGNYWSDYDGEDANGDGIGDTPYTWWVVDNYPLMNPYWNPADINHDLKVNLTDAVLVCSAYGSKPETDNWNPHCDIIEPYGRVNLYDAVIVLANYGKKYEDQYQ